MTQPCSAQKLCSRRIRSWKLSASGHWSRFDMSSACDRMVVQRPFDRLASLATAAYSRGAFSTASDRRSRRRASTPARHVRLRRASPRPGPDPKTPLMDCRGNRCRLRDLAVPAMFIAHATAARPMLLSPPQTVCVSAGSLGPRSTRTVFARELLNKGMDEMTDLSAGPRRAAWYRRPRSWWAAAGMLPVSQPVRSGARVYAADVDWPGEDLRGREGDPGGRTDRRYHDEGRWQRWRGAVCLCSTPMQSHSMPAASGAPRPRHRRHP